MKMMVSFDRRREERKIRMKKGSRIGRGERQGKGKKGGFCFGGDVG